MAKLTSHFAAALLFVTAPAPATADPLKRWTQAIAEAASRFGLPKKWIRDVMRVESGGVAMNEGRPLVSSAGAMGLMQLMPATWHDMQGQLRLGSNPFDPHDNIIAGSAYLKRMYDRFGYPGMFAAYNVGPTRYAALLLGHPLPAETRAYVKRLVRMEMNSRRELIERDSISLSIGRDLGAADAVQLSAGLFVPLVSSALPSAGPEKTALGQGR